MGLRQLLQPIISNNYSLAFDTKIAYLNTMNNDSPLPLELYIQVKTEMRDAKDAILKKHGITWSAWLELCKTVERAFPSEGVKSGGYEFRVETRDIEQFQKTNRTVIGQEKKVTIHKTRS